MRLFVSREDLEDVEIIERPLWIGQGRRGYGELLQECVGEVGGVCARGGGHQNLIGVRFGCREDEGYILVELKGFAKAIWETYVRQRQSLCTMLL